MIYVYTTKSSPMGILSVVASTTKTEPKPFTERQEFENVLDARCYYKNLAICERLFHGETTFKYEWCWMCLDALEDDRIVLIV